MFLRTFFSENDDFVRETKTVPREKNTVKVKEPPWKVRILQILHILYPSSNIIKADCKGRDLACLREMINAYNTLVKKNNERDHSGDNAIDEKTPLKRILKNQCKYEITVIHDKLLAYQPFTATYLL
jgi:hypothetical protein